MRVVAAGVESGCIGEAKPAGKSRGIFLSDRRRMSGGMLCFFRARSISRAKYTEMWNRLLMSFI